MNTEEQEQKLMALIEEYQDLECSELIEKARNKYREMIKAAHQDARGHVHRAVERERATAISRIRSAEAELHTKRRAMEQRFAESILTEGWSLLEQKLKKRWGESDGRRAWIKRCAQEALLRLPRGQWIVKHPLDCNPDELMLFSDMIAKESPDITVEMSAVGEIEAGLVIGANRTFLDMSQTGICMDRVSVEGRMLALLHKVGEE